MMVEPIDIPDGWDDNGLILLEEFCELIRTPQRTVRGWRRRGVGPRWTRFQGVGRLYVTVRRPGASSHPPRSRGWRCVPMAERRALPVYLSLKEAAECMSVSVKTIRRWIAAGTLPAYRCGKRAIGIKLEDLEAAPRQIPSARW
jgi:excisionase family DNA binding protein